jgi:hypothetical protein
MTNMPHQAFRKWDVASSESAMEVVQTAGAVGEPIGGLMIYVLF